MQLSTPLGTQIDLKTNDTNKKQKPLIKDSDDQLLKQKAVEKDESVSVTKCFYSRRLTDLFSRNKSAGAILETSAVDSPEPQEKVVPFPKIPIMEMESFVTQTSLVNFETIVKKKRRQERLDQQNISVEQKKDININKLTNEVDKKNVVNKTSITKSKSQGFIDSSELKNNFIDNLPRSSYGFVNTAIDINSSQQGECGGHVKTNNSVEIDKIKTADLVSRGSMNLLGIKKCKGTDKYNSTGTCSSQSRAKGVVVKPVISEPEKKEKNLSDRAKAIQKLSEYNTLVDQTGKLKIKCNSTNTSTPLFNPKKSDRNEKTSSKKSSVPRVQSAIPIISNSDNKRSSTSKILSKHKLKLSDFTFESISKSIKSKKSSPESNTPVNQNSSTSKTSATKVKPIINTQHSEFFLANQKSNSIDKIHSLNMDLGSMVSLSTRIGGVSSKSIDSSKSRSVNDSSQKHFTSKNSSGFSSTQKGHNRSHSEKLNSGNSGEKLKTSKNSFKNKSESLKSNSKNTSKHNQSIEDKKITRSSSKSRSSPKGSNTKKKQIPIMSTAEILCHSVPIILDSSKGICTTGDSDYFDNLFYNDTEVKVKSKSVNTNPYEVAKKSVNNPSQLTNEVIQENVLPDFTNNSIIQQNEFTDGICQDDNINPYQDLWNESGPPRTLVLAGIGEVVLERKPGLFGAFANGVYMTEGALAAAYINNQLGIIPDCARGCKIMTENLPVRSTKCKISFANEEARIHPTFSCTDYIRGDLLDSQLDNN